MYIHDRIDPNHRFRERRRQMRRRRRIRRALLLGVLLGAAAGIAVGATFITREDHGHATRAAPKAKAGASGPALSKVPREIRGVHVTMALASLPGKLDEYLDLRAYGLNTLELDVKDENGKIAFVEGVPELARETGAARPYYDAERAAAAVHAAGVYLIGRVVVFEDPTLAAARPDMALRRPDGSIWRSSAGLGWSNPYDRRVWKYNVDVAEAAARAGFDEIMFDYVRFPSDGNVDEIVYDRKLDEPRGTTILRFLAYARKRLHPLGVRTSAAVFGLAATHDLRIGQVPKRLGRVVDVLYPMVYPSHYRPGEYGIVDPDRFPGRTVANSLLDFKRAVRGERVRLVPWLQDFSLATTYGLIEVTDQIAAARRQRAGGFLLWNPEGVYTKEALAGPSG